MKSLAISAFKSRCIAELKALQENGGELVITLRGQPLARVVPIRDPARQLGTQAGRIQVRGQMVNSDLDEDFSPAEAKRLIKRRQA